MAKIPTEEDFERAKQETERHFKSWHSLGSLTPSEHNKAIAQLQGIGLRFQLDFRDLDYEVKHLRNREYWNFASKLSELSQEYYSKLDSIEEKIV